MNCDGFPNNYHFWRVDLRIAMWSSERLFSMAQVLKRSAAGEFVPFLEAKRNRGAEGETSDIIQLSNKQREGDDATFIVRLESDGVTVAAGPGATYEQWRRFRDVVVPVVVDATDMDDGTLIRLIDAQHHISIPFPDIDPAVATRLFPSGSVVSDAYPVNEGELTDVLIIFQNEPYKVALSVDFEYEIDDERYARFQVGVPVASVAPDAVVKEVVPRHLEQVDRWFARLAERFIDPLILP